MNLKSLLTIFLTVSLAISCSKVDFSNSPSASCAAADRCQVDPSGETLSKKLVVPYPNLKTDILFVVDNSKTMLDEQSKIAARLQGFLSSISNLDYRIAITTTDNRPVARTDLYSPQDYRNGALVPFLTSASGNSYALNNGNKIYFITKSTPNASTLFYNTIKRPESTWCSQMVAQNPFTKVCESVISGDERANYSAIKNISTNAHSFMRADAQLHVIIISDEDERSNGGGTLSGVSYPMETGKDRAEDLLNTLRALNKRTKVHSIVAWPYGFNSNSFDFASCVNSQIGATSGEEFVGCNYIKASIDSGGIVGNKDSSDYTSILNTIGSDIQNTSINKFSFNCVPSDIIISSVSGAPFPSNYSDGQSISSYGKTYITFSPALQPGAQMMITWKCPRI